jgi:hypothetical protein
MTTYVCVEVSSLVTRKIKAATPKRAIEALKRQVPGATDIRISRSLPGLKEVFIHYTQI